MTLSPRFAEFSFSLAGPKRAGAAHVSTRNALAVEFEHAGARGYGEAAPLPGYSDESWDDVLEQSLEVRHAVTRQPPRDAAALDASIRHVAPSLRFAFEAAFHDARARAAGRPLHALLGDVATPTVRSAWLLDTLDLEPVQRRLAYGAPLAIKLKIGRDLERELAFAAALRALLGEAWELRLDANGRLDARDVRTHARAFAALGHVLLEEPYPTSSLEAALSLGLPLALDESLRRLDESTLDGYLSRRVVSALVLKPTTLGLHRSLDLARRARASGVRAILSHAHEGPIARAVLAELAFVLPEPAPGLDAHPATVAGIRTTRGPVGDAWLPSDAAGSGVEAELDWR